MSSWYVWVFSGVGGTALVSASIAVYQRYSARPSGKIKSTTVSAGSSSPAVIESPGSLIVAAPVTDSPVAVGSNITQSVEVHHHHNESRDSEEWKSTEPTPTQILREVSLALPFDKDHARQKYENLHVVWETSICSVKAQSTSKDCTWYMISRFPAETDSLLFVSFALSSVSAELRSATRGSVLLVKGVIKSVGAVDIELRPDPEIRIVKRLPLL